MEEIEVKLSPEQIQLTLVCIENAFGRMQTSFKTRQTRMEFEELTTIYRKALDTHKNTQAKEYIGW
jgi:hypothetical protein